MNEMRVQLLQHIVEIFPPFDPRWPKELVDAWVEAYGTIVQGLLRLEEQERMEVLRRLLRSLLLGSDWTKERLDAWVEMWQALVGAAGQGVQTPPTPAGKMPTFVQLGPLRAEFKPGSPIRLKDASGAEVLLTFGNRENAVAVMRALANEAEAVQWYLRQTGGNSENYRVEYGSV